MKKLIVALMILGFSVTSALCAEYNTADRVPVVGKILLEKNGLPSDTTFQVIDVSLTILTLQKAILSMFQTWI